jgi:putative transposase
MQSATCCEQDALGVYSPMIFQNGTVYEYFHKWEEDGTWVKLNQILREQVRIKAGRNPKASAGSIDSQSVKKAGAGQEGGYDEDKKINGRKRTILVDTMGLLLGAGD